MPITSRQTGSLLAENWTKVYQTFRDADFTSYDFESLRKTMIDYIKINYAEEFNDFTESSEFIALIDLIAYLGQSLAFRTDLNARENFIDTAERRDSILKLARLISYNPKRNICASGYLKIDSVSTTETIFDSDGLDLSNRIVIWNDLGNSNWFEQFVSVINASLVTYQTFGRPSNRNTINNIRTEEYGINLINNILPIYRFESSVNGLTTSFEVVSATSTGKSYIYEKPPDINQIYNLLYRNDSNGNDSNNTGFFLYFKQGELSNLDFTIDTGLPNKIVNIDIDNINNQDIWLYSLDSSGFVDTLWEQVVSTNVIYNTSKSKNIYQVNSRSNDQISLVFGDGSFANIPQGKFRLYYRVSNGNTYKITPDEIRGVQISFDYISRNNRVETVTFRASLRYTVANAKARESADEIKQRAPQQYYTQNRMITGEDYNILPYTTFSDIKKVKAINRISSGLSRYLDTLDVTGKYSSTNIFGNDGVLYSESKIDTLEFTALNRLESLKFIRNVLIPEVIDNKNVMHFFHDTVLPHILEDSLVYEENIIKGEVYEIISVGTTNFMRYGATDNTIGTVFRSDENGKRTLNYALRANKTDNFYINSILTSYNPTIGPTNGSVGVSTSMTVELGSTSYITIYNAPPGALFRVKQTYTGIETAPWSPNPFISDLDIIDSNGIKQIGVIQFSKTGIYTFEVEFMASGYIIEDGSKRTYTVTVNAVTPLSTAINTGIGTVDQVTEKGSLPNTTIRIKVGEQLSLVNLSNQPVHIKSFQTGGVLGNVTVGTVENNGGSTGTITWDTTNVVPGVYYYVSRNYTTKAYNIDDFVAANKGSYTTQEYKKQTLKILKFYLGNNEYKLSNDEYRYGLYRTPDVGGLSFWVNSTLVTKINVDSENFYDIFFAAADAVVSGPLANRHLAKTKNFVAGDGGGFFYDRPPGWGTNHLLGEIIVEEFGTGTCSTNYKWHLSSTETGVSTGYFTYNGQVIPVGPTIQNDKRFLSTGALVKFVPDYNYHFNSNLNMLKGPLQKTGDTLAKFAAITQVYGDGSNNGTGNFSNGTGPVKINLAIPTGAVVESIIPTFKNSLRTVIVDAMVSKILVNENFGLVYTTASSNWVMVDATLLSDPNAWWIKFEFNSTHKKYVVSYKNLQYVFHSPKETNFFFDSDLQIYDPVNNEVINDKIIVLDSNKGLNENLTWFIESEIKRSDGFIENKSINLTYADTNQDGVPDVNNIFEQIVSGAPYITSFASLNAKKNATRVNYIFKKNVGRFPTQIELDNYVGKLLDNSLTLTDIQSLTYNLSEALMFRNGKFTNKNLVYFQLVKNNSNFTSYELLDNNKVIDNYLTKADILAEIKNYLVGQLFFARGEKQFYRCQLDAYGLKELSVGLNSTSSVIVPNYKCFVGRQEIRYQYRHNSPNSNRIDPNIGNIIDIYVLTAEYETNYRLWLEDTSGKLSKPDAPTDLELQNKYTELENLKAISDTIVIQSAVYKPLFGSKADVKLQSVFKVVKNPNISVTDAEIKSSVIAAVNEFFSTENWDFGEVFYFSELAAYLHKTLSPNIAAIIITSKNLNMTFGNLYQINSEPYELLISAATVDDVEIVSSITTLELQPITT